MSKCRAASEIKALGYSWIPQEFVERYSNVYPEDFVMIVRNSLIYSFMFDDTIPEGEKVHLSDLADAIIATLNVNGFIRSEILFSSTPEAYFAEKYLDPLALSDEEIEALMPYFCDNESYERYDFCYDRIEAVLKYLSSILEKEEYAAVNIDIMFMNDEICDPELLAQAKTKFFEKREEILPKLIEIFAKY